MVPYMDPYGHIEGSLWVQIEHIMRAQIRVFAIRSRC